jgi:hypothetical protein
VLAVWRRALNNRSARRVALEDRQTLLFEAETPAGNAGDAAVLRIWLGVADSNAELFAAVERLIGDLIAQGDQREQERLRFYLSRWAAHPKAPSQSAARIMSSASSGLKEKEAQR